MQNFTGQTLKTYQVGEQIGSGGFGAVYVATQQLVDRQVALKVILPEHANTPTFVRRFETEAQLVARLEHPHIVPLYDYWREPNGAFLVMRYLRGGSMRDHLEETGAWTLQQTVRMLNQIAAALAFAHNHHVVHRDLKSDNILIDDEGNSYLSDFGIAKDIVQGENLTKDSIIGTPAYLSPEQIRGEGATPLSDVYALGILTYETLTATKPFFDMTPATVLFKQLNDPLPDIRDLRPDLPEALNLVLQRATAKDADLRYTTPLEFARDVQNVLRGSDSPDSTMDIYPAVASGDMSITRAEQEVFEPVNPYKGLRAFQSADAADFYGRSDLIERLMNALRENRPESDFLAVVGPSGSGKSSVVRAGILPKIQDGVLDDETNWYVADMIPGTHPLEELEAALLTVATQEIPGLLQQLKDDERGLVRAARRMFRDESERLVLFIDQFEELFTLVDDEADRQHFLAMLLAAIEDVRSRITVIVTIRADFYDRPLHYPRFGELIRQRTELVLPLTESELEETITRPAEQAGVSLETGLAASIINDVMNQPGGLPLLQYALTELFERREGRMLTFEAYTDIGGTVGALARRAEELFDAFSPDEQYMARQMFLRLVTPGEGTEDTRRRILQQELLSIGQNAATMQRVIDRFGKYRLLTFDRDPATRSSTIEVAHEALIRQWDRLREWLDANREGLRLHRWLNQSTDEWLAHDRVPDFLARGVRLERLEEWAKSGEIDLNDTEQDYLDSSISAREARDEAERLRQQRETRLEQQAQNRLRILAVFGIVAAIVGLGLAALAVTGQQEAIASASIAQTARANAEQNESIALSARNEARSLALSAGARSARLENEPQLALALIEEAVNAVSEPDAEVRRTLSTIVYAPGVRYRLNHHTKTITAIDFNHDGTQAVSISLEHTIKIFDIQTGDVLQTIDLPEVFVADVKFNPATGQNVLAAFGDGTIRLYDAATGEETLVIEAHEGTATTVSYMPDGTSAISAGEDHIARWWNLETGELISEFEGHHGAIIDLDISPNGRRLATSSADATVADTAEDEVERNVRIWNIATGEMERIITPSSGYVRTIDFSPNSQFIAIGVWDSEFAGTVRIYDLLNGFERNRFFAHPNVVSAVAFSPDGNYIASVAWDRVVRIWDIERGSNVQSFVGFPERILSMTFSPDGDYLLLGTGNYGGNDYALENEASIDSSIWLVDLKSRDERLSFERHTDWLWSVALSPDGQLAATGSGPLRQVPGETYDLSVRVWNVATGEQLHRLRAHEGVVDSIQFLPDGERLLSAGWDGNIILWDYAEEVLIVNFQGHQQAVYRVTVNNDGTEFISASGDGTVRRWNIDTGETIQTYTPDDVEGDPPGFNFAVYSPDESQILATGSDGVLRLWDTESAELISTFTGHASSANEAIFSPDGEFIASSSWDDSVRIWNVETGSQVQQFDHNGNTFGLAFSEDGEILLSTSEDTTIRMWNMETGTEIHRYTAHTDWIQEVVISADGTFAISAGQDGSAKVWRIDRHVEDILGFAKENRYARDLTCDERARFGTPFQCRPSTEVQ